MSNGSGKKDLGNGILLGIAIVLAAICFFGGMTLDLW